MTDTTPKSEERKSHLSDKINTLPSGWDLSSIVGTTNEKSEEASTELPDKLGEDPSDPEAKERTEWQLDPHLDRDSFPSKRDLSAY